MARDKNTRLWRRLCDDSAWELNIHWLMGIMRMTWTILADERRLLDRL
jgi:hypothetical protein